MQTSSILNARDEKPTLVVTQRDCLLTPSPRHTVDLEAHIDGIAGMLELELGVYTQNDEDFLDVVYYAFVPNLFRPEGAQEQLVANDESRLFFCKPRNTKPAQTR